MNELHKFVIHAIATDRSQRWNYVSSLSPDERLGWINAECADYNLNCDIDVVLKLLQGLMQIQDG